MLRSQSDLSGSNSLRGFGSTLELDTWQCRLWHVYEILRILACTLCQGGGSDAERTKKKKRGDRYSVQTSLIVAALKKMLPIGLNMCSPADQELINLAKIRYSLVIQ